MDWTILGDIYYIRYLDNRNKEGGNFQEMLQFNEAISNLGLVEIPLKGRSYTWSNMQTSPLLEMLEWFFISETRTISYPSAQVIPLSKPISDYTPYVVKIGTNIPKEKIFIFGNYWLEHNDFKVAVHNIWLQEVPEHDSAKRITAKFKRLRKGLKIWAKKLSNLASCIKACNDFIMLLDSIEEFRPLSNEDWNGRYIVSEQYLKLLSSQRIYWRQRATIRWVKLGDENTRFFQAKATIKYRANHITFLLDELGQEVTDHEIKAIVLWRAFKQRPNTTSQIYDAFELNDLLIAHEGLHDLESPSTKE